MTRVMIVEDDEPFLYVVERELRGAGYETIAFQDWMGVLEILETSDPVDLLITDLRLPAGSPNGVSLARMALARRPHLKVVYMTAFRDLALQAGPFIPCVVLKDADPGSVVDAVRSALAA